MTPGSLGSTEADCSDDSVDIRRSASPLKRKRSDDADADADADDVKRRRPASAAGFHPHSITLPPRIHPLNHTWSEELNRMNLLNRWMASVSSPIPELSPWRSAWTPEVQYPAFPVPFQFYPPPLHLATMTSHPFLPAPFYLPPYSATPQLPLFSGSCDVKLTPVPTLPAPLPAPVEIRVKSEIFPDETADDSAKTKCHKFLPESTLPVTAKKRPAFLSVETLLGNEPCGLVSKCENPPEEGLSVNPPEEELSVNPPPPLPRCEKGGGSYKNLSRERRQQANARERTRVHTISAAFENLRDAVPSFSTGQRLSKLSILRVASAYIMALGKLADGDAVDASTPTLQQCVDLCTQTLMTENTQKRRNKTTSGSDDDY